MLFFLCFLSPFIIVCFVIIAINLTDVVRKQGQM